MKNYNLAVLLGLGLFAASCTTQSKDTAESKDSIPTIPVTELKTQKTEFHRKYVGDIQAVKNVEIYARVKGYLEEVYVDEGKEVKKGQILFRINSEEYAAELAKANASLQSAIADAKGAELEMGRVKMLVEKNVVSKTEL
ncbi:efflux RND transporter periplasmic adaptor subunit, partial [Dyadobacter frigoris]